MRCLLLVDVQNDFLPGGALPVPNGDEIIPVINALQKEYDLVVASKDWHPEEHSSFHPHGGPWPPHCIQHSHGADFPSTLDTDTIAKVVLKGQARAKDNYSAFDETDLASYLREKKVDHIDIVGLATDVCVKSSVLDALKLGFSVTVIAAGCRSIDPDSRAFEEMRFAGAHIKD